MKIYRTINPLIIVCILLVSHDRECLGEEKFTWDMFLPAINSNSSGLPQYWQEGLGEGVNWGIAAHFPDDAGITSHPDVLASEDFESGTVVISTEEERYKHYTTVVDSISFVGKYSGEHMWPEGYNGPTTRFVIPDHAHTRNRPAYFIRMYLNFDKSFRPADGESGVGIKGFGIVADPFKVGNTHTPCDGKNWYNAQAQFVGWGPSSKPESNMGYLWVGHLYSYNPYPLDATASLGTVRISSPPVGDTPYRLSSYADPFHYIRYNQWHCYEVGLYLNSPGKNNGEARFWIDGVLQSRVTDLRFRDVKDLFPSHMHLNLHRTTADYPQTMIRWTDNIVLSTRYIGPMKKK